MPIPFSANFDPAYGRAVRLTPMIRRITANNPSPFTYKGTNSYLIGQKTIAILDPGPIENDHYNSLLYAIADHPVSHILLTHSHDDHSALAAKLSRHYKAPIVAEGPHRYFFPFPLQHAATIKTEKKTHFTPDKTLKDGEMIVGDDWQLSTVATPGHLANHLSFALENSGILFSGDHVMAWATTVIAPPEGSMSAYMQSLDKLLQRQDRVYLCGHGGPVYQPKRFVRALKAHCKMRERAIIERLRQGDRTIADIMQAIYHDKNPRLFQAARLSTYAHLMNLIERQMVKCKGAMTMDDHYFLA